MITSYNKLRRPLSLLLVLALLVPAVPVSGTNEGQDGGYILYEQAPAPADKIDPAVREALAREDCVEVLVKMTRQVNTAGVARDAGRNAPSGYRGRLAVRIAVVEELRTNAAAGQESILQYLEQEQGKGNVLEFQGYYIVNMLFVKAAPVVAELTHEIALELPVAWS